MEIVRFTRNLLFLAAVAGPAAAVPNLQLDALGGFYDPVLEDSVSSDPTFTLRALLGDSGDLGFTFYVSAAILDSNGDGVASGTDFGSFSLGGTSYSSATYGSPAGFQSHGVFPTLYIEQAFQFSAGNTTGEYDTATCTAESDPSCVSTTKSLFFEDLAVDATGLTEGYNLHFDLYRYVEGRNGGLVVGGGGMFAPFSHDASTDTETEVPEPGSLVLLAAGIIGLTLSRRILSA